MERIKLSLPTRFFYSTLIPVRITDLNYGGHVGNDTFLSLMHEARVQFLQHHGYTELNFETAGLIMADVAIEYKKELKYGDQLKISVAATGFDKFGFDLYYLVEIIDHEETIVAAKAKTGMLCYDYAAKKLVKLPEQALSKLDQSSPS